MHVIAYSWKTPIFKWRLQILNYINLKSYHMASILDLVGWTWARYKLKLEDYSIFKLLTLYMVVVESLEKSERYKEKTITYNPIAQRDSFSHFGICKNRFLGPGVILIMYTVYIFTSWCFSFIFITWTKFNFSTFYCTYWQ